MVVLNFFFFNWLDFFKTGFFLVPGFFMASGDDDGSGVLEGTATGSLGGVDGSAPPGEGDCPGSVVGFDCPGLTGGGLWAKELETPLSPIQAIELITNDAITDLFITKMS
jgi:hypothetical protein